MFIKLQGYIMNKICLLDSDEECEIDMKKS